jgi:hypothetical protein
LVNFYQTTRCYNPEDSNLHTHRRENLKSYTILTVRPPYQAQIYLQNKRKKHTLLHKKLPIEFVFEEIVLPSIGGLYELQFRSYSNSGTDERIFIKFGMEIVSLESSTQDPWPMILCACVMSSTLMKVISGDSGWLDGFSWNLFRTLSFEAFPKLY